jgi:CTP:molybdopterin cytidylyltransferase MocA
MFGYLCRLPNWHSKYQYDAGFQAATDDNFCVVLEADDPRFTAETAQALLAKLGAADVRVVHEAIEQD